MTDAPIVAAPAAPEPGPAVVPFGALSPEARVAAFQADLRALCLRYGVSIFAEANIIVAPAEMGQRP